MIVKSFVQIGWHLTRIDKSGAYKTDGYQTIAEFAKAEYGLSATTTSRFMSVYAVSYTHLDVYKRQLHMSIKPPQKLK